MSDLSERLAASGKAAEGRTAQPCSDAVLRCPIVEAWIGLQLSDPSGAPIAEQAYGITAADGTVREGKTDAQGSAREERLPQGSCCVTLDGLSGALWAGTRGSGAGESEGETRTVAAGESIHTLALAAGLTTSLIWNHPNNAALRKKRESPDVLALGDQVFVPGVTEAKLYLETGSVHALRCQRDGAENLSVQLLDLEGKPRANLPFLLEIGGALQRGATDASGMLTARVPASAATALLVTREGGREESVQLALRQLAPLGEAEGVRQRLVNLGFGSFYLKQAIESFQRKQGLKITGAADAPTKKALEAAYRSR